MINNSHSENLLFAHGDIDPVNPEVVLASDEQFASNRALILPKEDYTSTSPPEDDAALRSDSVAVVGRLDSQRQSLTPGEKANFVLSLVNNGDKVALFTPYLEGGLPETTCTFQPSHTRLNPGEQTTFTLTLKVPRLASLRPGCYTLAVVVRSSAYPQQSCMLAIELTLLPYVDVRIGHLQPQKLNTSWRNPETTTTLPVRNEGNVPVDLYIQGADVLHQCHYEMVPDTRMGSPRDDAASVLLPTQVGYFPIAITPHRIKPFGVHKETIPFRVEAHFQALCENEIEVDVDVDEEMQTRFLPDETQSGVKIAYGQITHHAVVGPGILLAFTGTALAAMLLLGLTLLVLLVILTPRTSVTHHSLAEVAAEERFDVASEVDGEIAQAVPSISGGTTGAGLRLDEIGLSSVGAPLVITSFSSLPPDKAVSEPEAAEATVAENDSAPRVVQAHEVSPPPTTAADAASFAPNLIDGVPIVRPDMVTSPDQLFTIDPATAPTGPREQKVTTPAASPSVEPQAESAMTYEEMFRTIAHYYALDWRLLAAQAYVESSFNPLALGKQGDLGLMQVMPTTWQEFASQVGAQDPFDSYSNVLVAAAYLDYLRNRLAAQGLAEKKWVLIAYNWGPNQLSRFLQQGGSWDSLSEKRKKYALDIIRIAESLPND